MKIQKCIKCKNEFKSFSKKRKCCFKCNPLKTVEDYSKPSLAELRGL